MKKLIKASRQSGMALAEVMVAAGLLGGLSLVIVKLSEGGNKAVSRVEKSLEISELNQEIITYLSKKPGCTKTLFLPRPVTDFSGANTISVPGIKNDANVTVYAIPFERMLVKLNSAVLSDYDPALKTATLAKNYTFKLSPTESVTKIKNTKIALSVDGSGIATECIAKAAEADGPWILNDYGIYYSAGTVGVNFTPVDSTRALIVDGEVLTGTSNTITVPTTQANSVFGGISNNIMGATTITGTIAGGNQNKVSGGSSASVFGGLLNNASGNYSSIFGGAFNVANANMATVIGSQSGQATGYYSMAIGGQGSKSTAYNAIVVGGNNNLTSGGGSLILGGYDNVVSAWDSVSIGAMSSIITGSNSVVVGGYGWAGAENKINSTGDVIVGGAKNLIDAYGNSGNGIGLSAIIAGNQNSINGTANQYNTILGGQNNVISASFYNAIVNGYANKIQNSAINSALIASQGSTIDTGYRAAVVGCLGCLVSNGGNTSLAVGWKAHVDHPDTAVLAGKGSIDQEFHSNLPSQFSARYPGGFRFCTDDNYDGTTDAGCIKLVSGGVAWTYPSDKNLKTQITDVDQKTEELIFKNILELPISFWKYKSHKGAENRNLGPMAQDFHRLFAAPLGLYSKEKEIASADVSGVQFVAIKGLTRKVQSLEEENLKLKEQNSMISARLSDLELKLDLILKSKQGKKNEK